MRRNWPPPMTPLCPRPTFVLSQQTNKFGRCKSHTLLCIENLAKVQEQEGTS